MNDRALVYTSVRFFPREALATWVCLTEEVNEVGAPSYSVSYVSSLNGGAQTEHFTASYADKAEAFEAMNLMIAQLKIQAGRN